MIKSFVVFFSSLACSGYGIWRAVYITQCKEDAQRGGSVGTALTLFFYFMSSSYGTELYNIISGQKQSASTPPRQATQEEIVTDLVNFKYAILTDAKMQKRNNLLYGLATLVATIVWGFGDAFVKSHILHPACH